MMCDESVDENDIMPTKRRHRAHDNERKTKKRKKERETREKQKKKKRTTRKKQAHPTAMAVETRR